MNSTFICPYPLRERLQTNMRTMSIFRVYVYFSLLNLITIVARHNYRIENYDEIDTTNDDIRILSRPNRMFTNSLIDYETSIRWPNAEIPYDITELQNSPNFVDEFQLAINEFEMQTCINFRPRSANDRHFIKFSNGEGCWSYVGMQPELTLQGQEVSLSRECWKKGIIIHEMMHVLGFYHEHSRYDRDTYISLNLTNIQPNRIRQFDRRHKEKIDDTGSYDLYSIMHYEQNAFAMDKRAPTIIPRFSSAKLEEMGQRKNLSPLDVHKINEYYNCTGSSRLRYRPSFKKTNFNNRRIHPNFELDKNIQPNFITEQELSANFLENNNNNFEFYRQKPHWPFNRFSNNQNVMNGQLPPSAQNNYPPRNNIYGPSSNSIYSKNSFGPQTINGLSSYGPSSYVYPQTNPNNFGSIQQPNNIILPQTYGMKVPDDILPSIQCKSLEEANCMDRMDNCYNMATEGLCERKPGVMLKMCRRSCCNCNDQKCFDTKDVQKFNTLCRAETLQLSSGRKLNACEVDTTKQNAMEYCPVTCNTCSNQLL